MAGKVLEYELEYRDNGESKVDRIKISFISNYVIREYNSILSSTLEVKHLWDRLSDVMTEISAAMAREEPEKTIDDLMVEQDALTDELSKYSEDNIVERRVALLSYILKDNGVTDEKFSLFDFWDRSVEPAVQLDFLEQCAYKDIDKKKVV